MDTPDDNAAFELDNRMLMFLIFSSISMFFLFFLLMIL